MYIHKHKLSDVYWLATTNLEPESFLYGDLPCKKTLENGECCIYTWEKLRQSYSCFAKLHTTLTDGKRIWDIREYGYLVPHPVMKGLYGLYHQVPQKFSSKLEIRLPGLVVQVKKVFANHALVALPYTTYVLKDFFHILLKENPWR